MTGAARRGIKDHGFDRTQTTGPRLRRLRPLALLPGQMPLLRFQQPCPARLRVRRRRYLNAILSELKHRAALTPERIVRSIFFGGGTPSLMAPETVGRIIEAVGHFWKLDSQAEITLEANPTSVEAGRFAAYRAAGVNRVSLGVQALNDADLKTLGRMHSVAEAMRALDIATSTFSARLVRPDLRQAGTDAAGLGGGTARSAVARAGTPVALPAHHRAGHDVRAAVRRRQAEDPRTGRRPRALGRHPGADGEGGHAGL